MTSAVVGFDKYLLFCYSAVGSYGLSPVKFEKGRESVMAYFKVVVPGVPLPATPARKGVALPESRLIDSRNPSVDMLPNDQPAGPAKLVVIYETLAYMTFREMLAAHLGVALDTKMEDLETLADARGLGVAPDQIQFVLKQTANNPVRNLFGLLLRGGCWANFWLVKVSDQPGEKFVVVFASWYCDVKRWSVCADLLSCPCRWSSGCRFFFGELVGP